ncbi:MAG: M20/M25/M40 family metallo-hydrolase [Kofleriaceae bacterium]
MRQLLLAAVLSASAYASPTIISTDRDALDEFSDMKFIEAGDHVVLSLDDAGLAQLSERMHLDHHRCGGFMVHDSVADALAAPVPEKKVSYSLDHARDVEHVLPTLSADRIATTIRQLSAMPTRFYKSAGGEEASNWLAERWRAIAAGHDGVTVTQVSHGWPQKSVVMTVPGTTRKDEVVVIGGHLDSINFGGGVAPGADDDASGISTITEIAQGLMEAGYRPERTLVFVAYEAEEVGLLGSQKIVADFKRAGTNVVGAMQLDMTNYKGSDKDIWLIQDYTSAAQNAFLEQLITTYLHVSYGKDKCGYACSDHASWFQAGVPASMPFEARSKQMNPRIHTTRDTLAMSNDQATHALNFAKLGAAYAIEMCKGTTNDHPGNHNRLWELLGLSVLAFGSIAAARRVF